MKTAGANPLKLILTAEAGLSGAWEFTGPEAILIGRDHRCVVKPEAGDYSPALSRFQSVIELGGSRAVIRDLGSLGGTWLNGLLVGRRDPARPRPDSGQALQGPGVELADGDIIAAGSLRLRVLLADAALEKTSHQVSLGCANCGGPLSRATTLRAPDALCENCRANPVAALKLLQAGLGRRLGGLAPLKSLRVVKTLGRGATSAVFLATRKKSESRLALKVMPPSVSDNDWARKSFLREAALGRALSHPNVARMFESGRYGGAYFALMEYCSGGSAEEARLAAGGRLSVERALAIILPALDGLSYLHQVRLAAAEPDGTAGATAVGLVHRDLKPANIFLGGFDGLTPKIADIGVAKFHGRGGSCDTRTGTVAGSPATMPRQQAMNFKYAGPEVDVWAAAASLYKLLTGEYPREFPEGRDPWQVVMSDSPRPLKELLPDAPEHLAETLDEALVDDPAIFHQTAESLKKALLKAAERDDLLI
ncbi:MAG: protein kinase [Candidatus Adiutrix sp.]|jgi:hypothetical protein|nr:protein kinase [Candidatus Adiutrix sp.]